MSSDYPPQPPTQREGRPWREESPSASQPSSSLYDRSPHLAHDTVLRRRRSRVSCGLDPLHVVALIVLLGSLVNFFPWLFYPSTYLPFPVASPIVVVRRNTPYHCGDKSGSSSCSSMVWQKTFTLPSASKGCHLVTPSVEREISEGLKGVKAGLLTLFIQHTSAALSINENYDSTVRTDMNMAMDKIVPESMPWQHVDEGPDDSASHTKASLFGSSVTIPITDGRLNLGTWQGIYLCEFRKMKHSRRIVATVLP